MCLFFNRALWQPNNIRSRGFHVDDINLNTISADDFGASLRGFGLNLLVSDVRKTVDFLNVVFGIHSARVSDDFAIVIYGDQVFMLHSDAAYASNPIHAMIPETPPRGGGITIHLYDSDPDMACANCANVDAVIMAKPKDKPHGLREAFIADHDGYIWAPSRPL